MPATGLKTSMQGRSKTKTTDRAWGERQRVVSCEAARTCASFWSVFKIQVLGMLGGAEPCHCHGTSNLAASHSFAAE